MQKSKLRSKRLRRLKSLTYDYNKLHSELIVAEILQDEMQIKSLLSRIHQVALQQNLSKWGPNG